jgi:hypothetical protein
VLIVRAEPSITRSISNRRFSVARLRRRPFPSGQVSSGTARPSRASRSSLAIRPTRSPGVPRVGSIDDDESHSSRRETGRMQVVGDQARAWRGGSLSQAASSVDQTIIDPRLGSMITWKVGSGLLDAASCTEASRRGSRVRDFASTSQEQGLETRPARAPPKYCRPRGTMSRTQKKILGRSFSPIEHLC